MIGYLIKDEKNEYFHGGLCKVTGTNNGNTESRKGRKVDKFRTEIIQDI